MRSADLLLATDKNGNFKWVQVMPKTQEFQPPENVATNYFAPNYAW